MLPHKAKATNTLSARKTVRVAVRHEASNRNQKVVIEVADEGMGVPDTLKEKIFERFWRGPTSPRSGLGLASARQVARDHGGDVPSYLGLRAR